jgi:hypothetical protein
MTRPVPVLKIVSGSVEAAAVSTNDREIAAPVTRPSRTSVPLPEGWWAWVSRETPRSLLGRCCGHSRIGAARRVCGATSPGCECARRWVVRMRRKAETGCGDRADEPALSRRPTIRSSPRRSIPRIQWSQRRSWRPATSSAAPRDRSSPAGPRRQSTGCSRPPTCFGMCTHAKHVHR